MADAENNTEEPDEVAESPEADAPGPEISAVADGPETDAPEADMPETDATAQDAQVGPAQDTTEADDTTDGETEQGPSDDAGAEDASPDPADEDTTRLPVADEAPDADAPDADAPDAGEQDEETTPVPTDADAPELYLRYVTHSETGPVRKNNQDSGYASPNLLVVADGMGGAAAGDLASSIAIDHAKKADHRVSGEDMLEVLAGAVERANSQISDLVTDDRALDGMGTTLTGAMFDGHQLGFVHIGDSRAYLLRDGEMQQLTHDHSWVQSLIDEGKLTIEEAAYHPHRSLILKVINGQPNNEPDTGLVDVREGDRLLFCSDGLCGMIDDDEIHDGLAIDDLDASLDALVAGAHAGGGMDNITIVIADVVADETSATTRASAVGAITEHDLPAFFEQTRRNREKAEASQPSPASPSSPSDEDEPDDPEADRYAPVLAPKSRRRLWTTLLTGLGILVLLAGVLTAGYVWSRTQYFVAPAEERVAIYHGLPQDVLGYPLSDVYEVQPTKIDDLPPFFAQRVRDTIVVDSLDEAHRTTEQLQAEAERCIEARNAANDPPKPPKKPGRAPTPTPAGSETTLEGC